MPNRSGWHRVPNEKPAPVPAWLKGATVVAYGVGAVALVSLAFGWLIVALAPRAADIVAIVRPTAVVLAFAAAVVPVFAGAHRIGSGDLRFAHPLAAWLVVATLVLAVPWHRVQTDARWTLNASGYETTARAVASGAIKADADGTAWLAGPAGSLSDGERALVRHGRDRVGVFFYVVDPVVERPDGFLYLTDLRPPAADVLRSVTTLRALRPHWYYVQFPRDANPPPRRPSESAPHNG